MNVKLFLTKVFFKAFAVPSLNRNDWGLISNAICKHKRTLHTHVGMIRLGHNNALPMSNSLNQREVSCYSIVQQSRVQ